MGKMFCLRGGEEHRFLKLSQLKRTDEKYVYYENVSKNRNGSFTQLHVQSKIVPLYPNEAMGDCCPVSILEITQKGDLFYMRPLQLTLM